MLEWLGDIGGLADAFHVIGVMMIGSFANFELKSRLMTAGFRTLANHQDHPSRPGGGSGSSPSRFKNDKTK